MPFVTEELWLELVARRGYDSATIMLERFPQANDFAADAAAEDEIAWLKGFVGGIRQIRGEANLPRSATLNVRLADATPIDRERVERHASHLRKLAGLDRIEFVAAGETVKGAATALLGAMRILVPLAGLIDVAGERERLGKQLAKTRRRSRQGAPQAREPELRRERTARRRRERARARRRARAARHPTQPTDSPASPSWIASVPARPSFGPRRSARNAGPVPSSLGPFGTAVPTPVALRSDMACRRRCRKDPTRPTPDYRAKCRTAE